MTDGQITFRPGSEFPVTTFWENQIIEHSLYPIMLALKHFENKEDYLTCEEIYRAISKFEVTEEKAKAEFIGKRPDLESITERMAVAESLCRIAIRSWATQGIENPVGISGVFYFKITKFNSSK